MKLAKLPIDLQPIKSSLKRIGDSHDGGYLVSFESLLQSDCLISFGLEENWSFETHFAQENDVSIFCFDASVNKKHFRNKFIKSFFRFDKPQYFAESFKNFKSYKKFFNKPNHSHIPRYVTFDRDPDHISFQNIKDKILAPYNKIFFKIDIEGAEYRLLDQLIEIQNSIISLVIEFHDVDVNLDKIISFSKNFPLPIINLNVNNNGLIASNHLPTVIEITYAQPDKKNKFSDQNSMNNIGLEEISLNFDYNLL